MSKPRAEDPSVNLVGLIFILADQPGVSAESARFITRNTDEASDINLPPQNTRKLSVVFSSWSTGLRRLGLNNQQYFTATLLR